MNKLIIPTVVVLIIAVGIGAYFVFQKPDFPKPPSGQNETPQKYSKDISPYPQKFHVEGNKIVDELGHEAVLRGLTPIQPVTLAYDNKNSKFIPFNEKLFKEMSDWGAEIIRLPINPHNWRKYGKEKVFKIIDQSIEWSAKYDMYVYIDYHGGGFPPTEEYGEEWTRTTKKEMLEFWDETSKYYKDNDFVVFYELFNEPTFSGNFPPTEESLDTDWLLWKKFAEEVIDVIRKNDPDSVIMVGGLYWAKDISFAEKDPIERENIVYAVHPYPRSLWYPRTLDEAFGKIQEKYPVYVTEFGYSLVSWLKRTEVQEKIREYVSSVDWYRQEAEENSENKEYVQKLWREMEAEIYNNKQAKKYLDELDKDYEIKIKAYLDSRNIGWTAWSFSEAYNTQLLKDRNFTPTKSGKFFREWLLENK